MLVAVIPEGPLHPDDAVLGLVVGVVTQSDVGSADCLCDFVEKGIAHQTPGFLQRAPTGRGGDIAALARTRQASSPSLRGDELAVGGRFAPERVVEMGQMQLEVHITPQAVEHVEQNHRIDAARYGNEQTVADCHPRCVQYRLHLIEHGFQGVRSE